MKKNEINKLFKNKRFIAVLLIALIFIALIGPFLGGCFKKEDKGTEKPRNISPRSVDEGPKAPSPLTGLMVKESLLDNKPLAIMVENSPQARPQSGLDKADLIYEMMVEGGVTRFLAIYYHSDAAEVGPVRSARPYYLYPVIEYDAMYSHVGGSEEAFTNIRKLQIADLDEFRVGRKAYWRSADRKAPHNMYTDTVKLREVGAQKGFTKSGEVPSFQFLKKGEENFNGEKALKIKINYPIGKVDWEYHKKTGSYIRFNGGGPHTDKVTGKQLTATNIIVQRVPTRVIDEMKHLSLSMMGEGEAWLFTGGKAYKGIWSKQGPMDRTRFFGEDGREFKLNTGKTWIEVVSTVTKVEYSTE